MWDLNCLALEADVCAEESDGQVLKIGEVKTGESWVREISY